MACRVFQHGRAGLVAAVAARLQVPVLFARQCRSKSTRFDFESDKNGLLGNGARRAKDLVRPSGLGYSNPEPASENVYDISREFGER
jgi:hypothetical protein